MFDPCVANDGLTYERSAINRWQSINPMSPLTRETLLQEKYDNRNLREGIAEFLNAHPELWETHVYFPEAEMQTLLLSPEKTWRQISLLLRHPGFLTRTIQIQLPGRAPDDPQNNRTVFDFLCEKGPKEILKDMIRYLKNTNKISVIAGLAKPAKCRLLQRLFFDAVSAGELDNASLYLQLGADINKRDYENLTALELAQRSQTAGREAMIQFLNSSLHVSNWSPTAWGAIALGASIAGVALCYYLFGDSTVAPTETIANTVTSIIPEPETIASTVTSIIPDTTRILGRDRRDSFLKNASQAFLQCFPCDFVMPWFTDDNRIGYKMYNKACVVVATGFLDSFDYSKTITPQKFLMIEPPTPVTSVRKKMDPNGAWKVTTESPTDKNLFFSKEIALSEQEFTSNTSNKFVLKKT
jgi:hypothetical protein